MHLRSTRFRPRFLVLFAAFMWQVSASGAEVWQPVIDYTISFPGDRPDAAPIINPFENFTHMSSDFGWMGPGSDRIDARNGIIRVQAGGQWTGAWHSLAGLASQKDRTLDASDLIGLGGALEKRSDIREFVVNAGGNGTLRLELADGTLSVMLHDQPPDGAVETFLVVEDTGGRHGVLISQRDGPTDSPSYRGPWPWAGDITRITLVPPDGGVRVFD